VNRPEPTDLSIFIAQKLELFKEKMKSAGQAGRPVPQGQTTFIRLTELRCDIRKRLVSHFDR
jgi:hypothetical protein